MKRVVSVSLGSSKRDKTSQVEILGQEFEISRVGTDGDTKRFGELVAELDGKVDAISTWEPHLLNAGKQLAENGQLMQVKHLFREDFYFIANKELIAGNPETLEKFHLAEVGYRGNAAFIPTVAALPARSASPSDAGRARARKYRNSFILRLFGIANVQPQS